MVVKREVISSGVIVNLGGYVEFAAVDKVDLMPIVCIDAVAAVGWELWMFAWQPLY
jgi:hypothetical protein